MPILDFPDIEIAQVRWSLKSNTQSFRSPLTGSVQTLELPGAGWAAELVFNKLQVAKQRQLAAFLVRLRGSSGRFYFSDPTLPVNQGSLNGNPVVDLAVSGLKTAVGSSGWAANQTGVLLAGDMIGFSNGQLHMVGQDVDSDASGNATIEVEPPCRYLPTDATAIVVSEPKCIMRLEDDNQASWSTVPPLKSNFSIRCVESWT